jgi:CopA family copper-resistance protein
MSNEINGVIMTTEQLNYADQRLSRRRFVMGASATLAVVHTLAEATPKPKLPAQNLKTPKVPELTGTTIDLTIGYQNVNITGKDRVATTVNNSLPAPTLRLQEGERVTLRVTNTLEHVSSIHWHGILLPSEMDGVPGLSFDGIQPGETFTYQFDLVQSGTYWYHSHSDFQEQTGLYGALIIEPKEPEPLHYDRDLVVLLSDWTDESPHRVYAKLKKMSHYYNYNERTVGDWWRDVQDKGFLATWRERKMWNTMRMSDTDIADVNGATYTFLMNGVTPDTGWFGRVKKGERVRLRFINAAAMTLFDVRIPGLRMTVVAADGQLIKPITVDEFRMGTAETYDVIVEIKDDQAYTLFAQSIDRTGYALGTLAANPSQRGVIPPMDPSPVLTHRDMGMDHSAMGHGKMDHGGMDHSGHKASEPKADHSAMDHSAMNHGKTDSSKMDHGKMDHSKMNHAKMDHSQHYASESKVDHSKMDHSAHKPSEPKTDHGEMDHSQQSPAADPHQDHQPQPSAIDASGHGGHHGMQTFAVITANLGPAGFGSTAPIVHAKTEFGPQVDGRADTAMDGITDPGIGLREHQQRFNRRVLTYADLRNYYPTADRRQPTRELQIHLTGNMSRYMWSMNGVTHEGAAPIDLHYGERVRIVLINDTMMTHPIHLHGLWSELETGDPDFIPKKHTVLVQPGSKASYLVTADAKGRWAYHCHLVYHMPGMMREVRVG